ncbi:snake venom 5'-nucleotidase-like [Ptychodera flava]|uniref:snake venom 5'-nucleotidase-like n=1 Tax=Ptychodera flava TaxID=63121 RepID=UPI003969CCE9
MVSKKLDTFVLTCTLLAIAFVLPFATGDYSLTILHTNDVHARFEETDVYSGACSEDERAAGECYGGVARRATKIQEIRNRDDNVLLLDGGDQYQGTLWFYYYKGKATAHFMNLIEYDVMALGNHEFDNNIEGIVPFLDNVTFPVISSNIDDTEEPSIQGKYTDSWVFDDVGGEKIAVIGYTTVTTPMISSPGKLEFKDEIESIQAELDRLKNNDPSITKFIALGHSGIEVDLEIADKVQGVDVVIGGHSNTFLYTGDPPSIEDPIGEYPLVVNPSHDPSLTVLVAQSYAYGKYLGELQVVFDDDGDVIGYDGNPILLDNSTAQDPDTLAEIEKWREPLIDFQNEVIGRTNVFLQGERAVCRTQECNMGNMITDGMLHQNIRAPDDVKWNHVAIAIWNGGGIRASITQGDITVEDVVTVLPFGNTVDIVQLKGEHLLESLEHSVSRYSPLVQAGEFLQISGIHVKYDVDEPSGSRVVEAEVLCTECLMPEFQPLDVDKVYTLITSNFIANGGDGYTMISDNKLLHESGNLDSETIMEYISQVSPLFDKVENRIQFVKKDECAVGSARIPTIHFMILFVAFLVFICGDLW